MGGGLPLEDRCGLQAGVAGVLGEGSSRGAGSAGGSQRAWREAETARCVLPNTGVGRVQRERGGDAGGAGEDELPL